MRRIVTAATCVVALTVPAAAAGHVTVQPQELPAGQFKRVDVRVPNERDDAGTVKVDVQMPPGITNASYEPVPGWEVKVERTRIDEPIDVHGEPVSEVVSRVTFTGDGKEGIIEPGQFRDFGLSIRVPDGNAGDVIEFKALQTYEGGEVVRWIGAADADQPAARVTLTAAEGGHGAPAAAAEEDAASGAAAPGDDGGETLSVVALIVGGLGLLAGLAGLGAARRARPASA